MEAVATFEHAGLTVEIVPDEYVDEMYDPRECDQLGIMFNGHPDYNLGDEQLPRDGFPEIDCPACEGGEKVILGPVHQRDAFGRTVEDEPVCPRCENLYTVEPTVGEWLAEQKAIAAMPLFLLDHSGISMSSGTFAWLERDEIEREDTRSSNRFVGDEQGWDTSFIGFIITTRERCEELGVEITRENLERQLKAEVEEYDKYLTGDAGGFVIKNADGKTLESGWGFLGLWGDDADVRTEAKSVAEHCRDAIEREKSEREFWAARDVMTVC